MAPTVPLSLFRRTKSGDRRALDGLYTNSKTTPSLIEPSTPSSCPIHCVSPRDWEWGGLTHSLFRDRTM